MAYSWRYYDLPLIGIAQSLGAGSAVGSLTPFSLPAAAVVFGSVGAVLIGHELFVNGPVDDPSDLTEPVDALN